MLRLALLGVAALAALWRTHPRHAQDDADDAGFEPLFNGQDLTGWVHVGATKGAWSVVDGVLVCNGQGRGWIRPAGVYEDFTLRLEYKIERGSNGGVFLRTSEQGRPAFAGMEIQIIDHPDHTTGVKATAAIYDSVAPSRNMSRPVGEWNSLEITCRGRRVAAAHNGVIVVIANLDAYPELRQRLPRGYIGLQNHGTPVAFRNLCIKALT